MIGAAIIEVVLLTGTFWKASGEVYRAHAAALVREENSNEGSGTLTPISGETGDNASSYTWIQKLNPFGDAFIMNKPVHSSRKTKSPPRAAPSGLQKLNPFRKAPSTTAEAVKNRVTVLSAVFLLFYVGAEVSIGGWSKFEVAIIRQY